MSDPSRPASLRTILLVGLAVLELVVIGGLIATMYVRSHAEAHRVLREDLRLRAETLAGLLEIDGGKLDLEISPRVFPTYFEPGSGAYAAFFDSEGERVMHSPSLGDWELLPFASWENDAYVFEEVESGPDEIPCAVVTHSFLVSVEKPKKGSEPGTMPTEAERSYQVVVAADSRPRDASLTELLTFLGLLGGGAVVVTAVGAWLVARAVLRPVESMTREAAALTPQDTSRRLQRETVVRELTSLSDTLNSALDRLGDALDRQRRFTSDASHELRTPLAVLLGNVELLLRRNRQPEEYREGLERQRRIVRRMTDITENLLALSRADAGRARIERQPVALDELTRGVCDEFQALAAADGVTLTCHVDGDVNVDGDPMYLAELLQNLLSNAVKFTPADGRVDVRLALRGGRAVLDVMDTGPGIPEHERAHVFERFYRIHEGRQTREGAGLGLAIVRWIVEVHGGEIRVHESPDGGAAFTVLLPLEGDASDLRRAA